MPQVMEPQWYGILILREGILKSDFMPISSVARMDFEIRDAKIPANAFQMQYLSDLNVSARKEKVSALTAVVDSYCRWIEGIEARLTGLDERYQGAAALHIAQCEESATRMSSGIKTLIKNDKAYTAFMLANRAMYMQGFIRYPGHESYRTMRAAR